MELNYYDKAVIIFNKALTHQSTFNLRSKKYRNIKFKIILFTIIK